MVVNQLCALAVQEQLERDTASSESLVVVLSEVWLDEAAAAAAHDAREVGSNGACTRALCVDGELHVAPVWGKSRPHGQSGAV